MSRTKNVAIIGAGPAGIACAIQLHRYGLEPVLFERERIGGLLYNANLVENYPGFPKGISGSKLIKLFEKQLLTVGVRTRFDDIKSVRLEEDEFVLDNHRSSNKYQYIVFATGSIPKALPIFELETNNRTAHRDISELMSAKGKIIVIIGGGDAAFDHAIYLSKENKVVILFRGLHSTCIPLLAERVEFIKNIQTYPNAIIDRVRIKFEVGQAKPQKIIIEAVICGENAVFEGDEIIFAIGRDPNTELIKKNFPHEKCFLIGDVKNENFRQASIAIGDGVKAAMEIASLISRGKE